LAGPASWGRPPSSPTRRAADLAVEVRQQGAQGSATGVEVVQVGAVGGFHRQGAAHAVGLHRTLVDAAAQVVQAGTEAAEFTGEIDRKSTRLNSSHVKTSYAVFC